MIEPGCKQVYLWSDPTGAQEIEHLLRQGSLRLYQLFEPGQFVRYHIQATRDVSCPQDYSPGMAPGKKSPEEGTKRA